MVKLQKLQKEQAKARPAKKHIASASEGKAKNFLNGLSKVEGIITSKIELKNQNTQPYYLAFFQLEGISQDIPVIFKLDSSASEQTPPPIPPRAKVLLEGKWADSPTSPRPSFTCLAFQVIANPPPLTIKSLRERISQLLTVNLEKQSEWKQRVDYLFRKKKDLEKIEKLTKLETKYLKAYLLLKKAHYANYQDNLLPQAVNFNQETFLTKISQEIEETAQQVRAYQSKEISHD